MKKVKVIQFLGAAPSGKFRKQSIGGAEVFAYELVRHLDRQRFTPLVLLSGSSPLRRRFIEENVEVIDFRLKSKFDVWGILRLTKIIKAKRIDIINSHGVRNDFAGAVISLILRKTLVITRHVVISDDLLSLWKKIAYTLFDRFSITVAKIVVAISEYCRRKLVADYAVGPSKIRTIYCGVNFSKFHVNRETLSAYHREFDIRKNSLVVGTVAQLRFHKGIDLLIKVIPAVIDKFPNVLFFIIGEGPERNNLERLVERLDVNEFVRFAGYRDDASTIMQLFDVFVLTSRREGLPLVILEAMYQRKPVVATRVGAVSEVVKTGTTGILLDSHNTEYIAQSLIELLHNGRKREEYGRNARDLVVNEFDIAKAVSHYMDLYSYLS